MRYSDDGGFGEIVVDSSGENLRLSISRTSYHDKPTLLHELEIPSSGIKFAHADLTARQLTDLCSEIKAEIRNKAILAAFKKGPHTYPPGLANITVIRAVEDAITIRGETEHEVWVFDILNVLEDPCISSIGMSGK